MKSYMMCLRVGWDTFSSESSWTPKTQPNDNGAAVWLSFWCSTRPDRHWFLLIAKPLSSSWTMVKQLVVLISACERRSNWTPKLQPNSSSAVVWLSFWCSTRFIWKKCLSQLGVSCRLHSYIFYRWVKIWPGSIGSFCQYFEVLVQFSKMDQYFFDQYFFDF